MIYLWSMSLSPWRGVGGLPLPLLHPPCCPRSSRKVLAPLPPAFLGGPCSGCCGTWKTSPQLLEGLQAGGSPIAPLPGIAPPKRAASPRSLPPFWGGRIRDQPQGKEGRPSCPSSMEPQDVVPAPELCVGSTRPVFADGCGSASLPRRTASLPSPPHGGPPRLLRAAGWRSPSTGPRVGAGADVQAAGL